LQIYRSLPIFSLNGICIVNIVYSAVTASVCMFMYVLHANDPVK